LVVVSFPATISTKQKPRSSSWLSLRPSTSASRRLHVLGLLRVRRDLDHRLRPLQEGLPAVGRHADHLADYAAGQVPREVRQQVRTSLGDEPVDQLSRDLPNPGLHGGDPPRGEGGGRHQAAQSIVAGRIELLDLRQQVRADRGAFRRESPGIVGAATDVFEAGERPDATPRVVVDRMLLPQGPVDLVCPVLEVGAGGVVHEAHPRLLGIVG
jgi:hypothetical protein